MSNDDTIRLQVYLARSGAGSRRTCEAYISEGRVTVDGEVISAMGCKVDSNSTVTLDGRVVKPTQKQVYFVLNKPAGYICSNSDPEGRPIAADLLPSDTGRHLFHAGRLDLKSSGLIFYTSDGEFSRQVTHPSSQIEKEYQVEAKQPIPEEVLQKFKRGVVVEGVRYKLLSYKYRTKRKVQLVLTEGKNREIRNVFNHFRINVSKLHRVRIGSVHIGSLQPGEFRFITDKELQGLLNPPVKKKKIPPSNKRNNNFSTGKKPRKTEYRGKHKKGKENSGGNSNRRTGRGR